MKKANDGKIPKGYEGAYEKSLKKGGQSPKTIAPISVTPARVTTEYNETNVPIWPLLSIPPNGKVKPPQPILKKSPITPTSNHFETFQHDDDGDECDDEEKLMKTLNAMTSNVQRASDKSQSQKKRWKKPKALDLVSLNAIAQMVKSGEIDLPDVDLENDREYEYVWALVDSGAGANVARRAHFPNFTPVEAPGISLTVANGQVLDNEGAGEVVSYSRDGNETKRIFYEAPVEMPILAVAELAKEGEFGSEVRFRIKDGVIIDNLTGRRVHFVKRKGVYFMRMYFLKSSQPFIGPDP